ncbi:hypothetical protein [Bryobacter aggregatus]|uniref:hypothetical protein n=1 Tax=Bryobacter aggregatus TaxID=360054 RepID=UPI0012BABBDE|nr:hypothetical protein [Bryobacter aggregatus]
MINRVRHFVLMASQHQFGINPTNYALDIARPAVGQQDIGLVLRTDVTDPVKVAHVFEPNGKWVKCDKLRVEVWNSTDTTQLFADNVDTPNGADNLNSTTSGTSGYFSLWMVRTDPVGVMTGTGVQLDVAQVKKVTP